MWARLSLVARCLKAHAEDLTTIRYASLLTICGNTATRCNFFAKNRKRLRVRSRPRFREFLLMFSVFRCGGSLFFLKTGPKPVDKFYPKPK